MDDGGGGISELGDSTLDLPSESEGKILSIIPPNDSQILLDSDSLSLPSGQNTLVSEAGFPPTSVMLLFGDCILQEDVQGQEEDYFVNRFIRPNGQHKRGGDFLLFGRNSKEIDKCTALSNVVAADDAEAKENNGFVNNHLYDDEAAQFARKTKILKFRGFIFSDGMDKCLINRFHCRKAVSSNLHPSK